MKPPSQTNPLGRPGDVVAISGKGPPIWMPEGSIIVRLGKTPLQNIKLAAFPGERDAEKYLPKFQEMKNENHRSLYTPRSPDGLL